MGRLLVVDDDAVIRQLLDELLREEGYDVDLAADGREALDLLVAEPPDAVVLDLMMPVLDGYDFLMERRKLPGGERAPVVVLSAAKDAAHLVGTFGVTSCVTKPFEVLALLEAIAGAMDS